MQSINAVTNTFEKQQLRAMINLQTEEFIHKGGNIEVLTTPTERPTNNRSGSYRAAPGFGADHFSSTDID